MPLRWHDTGEFQSDHLRCLKTNALELFKPVNTGPELVKGLDVLSMQRLPGVGRQIEPSNGAFAGFSQPAWCKTPVRSLGETVEVMATSGLVRATT